MIPTSVEAAARIKAISFLIDGEAVIARDDGTPNFHALRSQPDEAYRLWATKQQATLTRGRSMCRRNTCGHKQVGLITPSRSCVCSITHTVWCTSQSLPALGIKDKVL